MLSEGIELIFKSSKLKAILQTLQKHKIDIKVEPIESQLNYFKFCKNHCKNKIEDDK